MKPSQRYGRKGPTVVPQAGMAEAPYPFVRFSLHGAHDKGPVPLWSR